MKNDYRPMHQADTWSCTTSGMTVSGYAKKARTVLRYFPLVLAPSLGEQRLRGWADDVMKHLDNGMSPADAKAWIRERLATAKVTMH